MSARSRASLPEFVAGNVLVVGDTILDIHHQGVAAGVSAETPTPVVKHQESRATLGGAAFLVRNMLALGGSVTFLTLTGSDEYAKHLEEFSHPRLKKVMFTGTRPTTVKERFWSGEHKLLAWDRVDNTPIPPSLEKEIVAFIEKNVASCERIVVSDYRHGLLTETLAGKIVDIAHRAKREVYVDSQVSQHPANHRWYRGADLFCVNEKEARSIDASFDAADPDHSLARLQKSLAAHNIILKRGERGSVSLLEKTLVETPAFPVTVSDTVGAGDAFFSVVACAKTVDEKTLNIANVWAGLKTTLKGTQTPTLEKLREALRMI